MKDDFPTTQWSLVLSAVASPTDRARVALARLSEAYWQPLYAYVRRRGYSADDAEDLVQGYFLDLIETLFIDGASPHAGRFRAFLLHTMKHFLTDERRKATALRRGGGALPIRLDTDSAERVYAQAMASTRTPEDDYDRQWALTIVDRVLVRLDREAQQAGKSRELEVLRPYLMESAARGSYGQAATELGMTEGAIKVAVHRLRKRFGKHLRATIAETVADPDEVEAEMRYLFAALER